MSYVAFREDVTERLKLRDPRFHEQAYMFVLSALEYRQMHLPMRRHISGYELAHACRDMALERFGLMARTVLDHWGIKSTADMGDVVFTLVDLGFLISQPTDTRDQFANVYDFGSAFDREYPWNCALAV